MHDNKRQKSQSLIESDDLEQYAIFGDWVCSNRKFFQAVATPSAFEGWRMHGRIWPIAIPRIKLSFLLWINKIYNKNCLILCYLLCLFLYPVGFTPLCISWTHWNPAMISKSHLCLSFCGLVASQAKAITWKILKLFDSLSLCIVSTIGLVLNPHLIFHIYYCNHQNGAHSV